MAEKERKTERLVENKNIGDYSSLATEVIEKNWNFGWDLENINAQMRESKSRDGVISYFGSFADFIYVRDTNIQNYDELVALEKEWNTNVPYPQEIASNLSWGIFTGVLIIIMLFFLLGGIVSDVIYPFVICGIVCVSLIGRIIGRISEIKAYKTGEKNYVMGGAAYKEAVNNYNKNKTDIYEKAQALTKSNALRLPLQASLDVWTKILRQL